MGVEEGHPKEERKTTFVTRYLPLFKFIILGCLAIACFIGGLIYALTPSKETVPKIELASMDFTVLNITDTRLNAMWDLSIRIPCVLPGPYICYQGDFQASFMYNNATLAISSPKRYSGLNYGQPQVLRVLANVSADGLIGKDITEDMKDKKEGRFGTRFDLTDCRENKPGNMRYACDDVTLRFEPGSEMKAALFGKNPSCVNY